MNKTIFAFFAIILALTSCSGGPLADVNMAIPENNWMYAKSLKTTFEIADTTQSYRLSFKTRNTADYRYSNLYVVMRLKGNGITKTLRYQFKMAGSEGLWTGKGSGSLYTNTFTLLNNYHFVKPGKYELEIEQNMRDNPLSGISDVGITVTGD